MEFRWMDGLGYWMRLMDVRLYNSLKLAKGVDMCSPVSPSQGACEWVSPLLRRLSTSVLSCIYLLRSTLKPSLPIKASQRRRIDYNSPLQDSGPWGRHSPQAVLQVYYYYYYHCCGGKKPGEEEDKMDILWHFYFIIISLVNFYIFK